MRRALTGAVLVLTLCVLCAPAGQVARANEQEPQSLKIISGERTHSFTVELARTPQEQAQGLMHRESLADDAGMLFIFPEEKRARFWMKNTLIPLDMVFIRKDGEISSIHHEAKPGDLTIISSTEPVKAVLEIRGGRAGALEIEEGDRIYHPAFSSAHGYRLNKGNTNTENH